MFNSAETFDSKERILKFELKEMSCKSQSAKTSKLLLYILYIYKLQNLIHDTYSVTIVTKENYQKVA